MINTVNTKQEQLENGYFKTGSGEEVILIMGSCRSVPYITYLDDWNNQNGNRFTINFIDCFNWNWDKKDERVDYEQVLAQLEKNDNILNLLRSTTIFIHEFYSNAGMFNCNKSAEKNIYQFGLNPRIDICLPNFNNLFILTADIVKFHNEIKMEAIQDYNVIGKLSNQTIEKINVIKELNLQKFYNICSLSDFPEFAEIFANQYKFTRYFWTHNHIGKAFTKYIFKLMSDKFLKLDLSNYTISEVDMYANNYTMLCEYDLGYSYGDGFKPLKEVL